MSDLRTAYIYVRGKFAGLLRETDEGYSFEYDPDYLSSGDVAAVSLTLPPRQLPYTSSTLFPFFDGLLPEGWLLDIVCRDRKISPHDRFGILLAACRDPVGIVTVEEESI